VGSFCEFLLIVLKIHFKVKTMLVKIVSVPMKQHVYQRLVVSTYVSVSQAGRVIFATILTTVTFHILIFIKLIDINFKVYVARVPIINARMEQLVLMTHSSTPTYVSVLQTGRVIFATILTAVTFYILIFDKLIDINFKL
jgi:hypothetical protein